MDVKTLNNGVMDVKILSNGVNVVRGTSKKKSCSAVKFGMARDEDAWGAKMGAVQENPPAPTRGGLVSHVQYCV